MKLMTTAAAAALSLAALGFAGAAQAQEYTDLVAFGDSLSDVGNLALFGAAPPPPYSGGRFSNGPVWVEQLGFGPLGGFGDTTGSSSWAFGGAWTSTDPLPPAMTTQVAAYLGSGGTFGGDDLVTLWGGANNIFDNLGAASVNPNPLGYISGVAVAAANDIGGLVNTVADAGAGTILVPNLPALHVTPQFNGHPAQLLAQTAATAYNTQLSANLFAQAAANPDANIILMDVYSAGLVLAADPGRFGFTNVTQTCFTGLSVCATPGTYLYWDGVHPTTAGHAFIAALATDYISYGDRSVPTAAQAETALRHRGQAVDAAFARLGGGRFDGEGSDVAVLFDAEETTVDARGLMPEVEAESWSMRIFLDHALSEGLKVGGQLSFTSSQVEAGPLTSFDSDSVGIDLYAGWRSQAGLFLNAAAGVGYDNYRDIVRVTAVPTVVNDASTDGTTVSAKLQGGWMFEMGGFTVSPRAAVGYFDGSVDGYVEDGEMVRHVIADRDIEAITAEASLRFEGDIGDRVGLYLEGGYRDNLEYDADPVTASLADNPASPLSNAVGAPDEGLAMVDAGLDVAVTETISVGAGYRGRFGDEMESHMGQMRLNWRF